MRLRYIKHRQSREDRLTSTKGFFVKVVVASQSALKIAVCKKIIRTFRENAELVTVKTASGVPEQPFGAETQQGAFNRLADAKRLVPDGDLYLSIENGIFREDDTYVDRAVAIAAVMTDDGKEEFRIAVSDGVVFPPVWVEETERRGTDKWTVGQVMAEAGVITQADDPHLDLSGKSRTCYLEEVLTRVLYKYLPHRPA